MSADPLTLLQTARTSDETRALPQPAGSMSVAREASWRELFGLIRDVLDDDARSRRRCSKASI